MLVIKLWGEWAKFSRATGEWTCRDADVLYYLKWLKEQQVFLREVMPYFCSGESPLAPEQAQS